MAKAGALDAPARRPCVAGLYAITPDLADTPLLLALAEAALDGGAGVLQYRNKTASDGLRRDQAARLGALCRARGVVYVVNDHADLALSIEGAGLHVGAEDATDPAQWRALRDRLGTDRLLGVSCYRSVEIAREAVLAGADYVAFGSLFPSTTKPHAQAAPLTLFADARGLGVATVGIGGIARDNIASLATAGADAAAVIGDLFASGEPALVREHARVLTDRFARARRAFFSYSSLPRP